MYHASHVSQSPGIDLEQPRRPKFEKDFIMLSEFSELVGPIPVCIIPEPKAAGNFNTNHFAVRIMSSDFQIISGKLVGPDTQVVLSEKQDCAYAYVHYFSLNDINARGYLRQFCFSYVASSPSKIMDNFEPLLEEFGKVTAKLKVSNHKVFQKDMSHHLADLQCTIALLKEEGLSESSHVNYTQLYTGFDFTKEDVPERDVSQVIKNIEETKDILAALREELEREESKQVWEDLHQMRRKYREQRRKDLKELERISLNTLDRASAESGFTSYLPTSPDSGAKMSESLSSSDSNEYVPQRVMTHFVHKFERRLRPLEELAPKAHYIAIERMKEIHKHFSRSEIALEMEKEEAELLDPCSSLLTIGRVPVLNFLQSYFLYHKPRECLSSSSSSSKCTRSCRSFSQSRQRVSTRISLQQPISCRISSKNTWGTPLQCKRAVLEVGKLGARNQFDTTFINDKLGLKHYPLYIDPVHVLNWRRWLSNSMTFPDHSDHSNSLTPCHAGTDSDSTNHVLSVPLLAPTSQRAREEEDGVSRGSTCTTFATPEDLTPRSSDGELDEHCAGRVKVGVVDAVVSSEGHNGANDRKEIKSESSALSRTVTVMLGVPECTNRTSSSACSLSGEIRSERGYEETTFAHDVGLEVSGGSSVPFHSASQSTLTESKETKPDVREDGQAGDRCDVVTTSGNEGGGDYSGPAYQCRKVPPLFMNDVGECMLGVASVEGTGGLGRCTSNSNTATPASSSNTATPASCSNSNTAPLASSSNSNTASLARSSNSNTVPPASSSSTLKSASRYTELEESYSIGSTSYKFSPSSDALSCAGVSGDGVGLGRWEGLEQLRGGLYHSKTNHLSKTSDSVADEESSLLTSAPGVPLFEEDGLGRWVWSRGNRTLPCSACEEERGIKQDMSSSDVFYTPTNPSTSSVFFFHSGSSRSSSQRFLSLSSEAGVALNGLPPSLRLPLSPGMRSVSSVETDYPDGSTYKGPSILEAIGKTSLPLVSSIDHIESPHSFKPGKGIVNFCRDIPVVKDLFYCLLHGRPLVLLGKPTDENLIRRLIRVLWLFVPGHSSQRQIITWQEAPLDIRDLSRVKLIGLSNKVSGSLPAHIKRYVSYWDCSTGKLYTPSYTGDLLAPIITRTKDKRNEEVFLTHIHSVLQDIAMKAFVYYHGYSAYTANFRRSPSYEASSKKFLTVIEKCPTKKNKIRYLQQQLGVKNSDVDIIEYFVDVIGEQLSVQLGLSTPNGSPYDDKPVRIQLHTKACTESFSCKPKKPY